MSNREKRRRHLILEGAKKVELMLSIERQRMCKSGDFSKEEIDGHTWALNKTRSLISELELSLYEEPHLDRRKLTRLQVESSRFSFYNNEKTTSQITRELGISRSSARKMLEGMTYKEIPLFDN